MGEPSFFDVLVAHNAGDSAFICGEVTHLDAMVLLERSPIAEDVCPLSRDAVSHIVVEVFLHIVSTLMGHDRKTDAIDVVDWLHPHDPVVPNSEVDAGVLNSIRTANYTSNRITHHSDFNMTRKNAEHPVSLNQ